MIASLRGTLVERGPDWVVVEAGGIGWAVAVTTFALAELGPPGAEVRLITHVHFASEQPPALYGFRDPTERRAFLELIGVPGVGPRVAMQVLSGLRPGELAAAIAAGDLSRLRAVRGIGRKLAERLVTELKEKLPAVVPPDGSPVVAASPPGSSARLALVGGARPRVLDDVAAALVALGYRPAQADRTAEALADRADQPLDTLIREALRLAAGR